MPTVATITPAASGTTSWVTEFITKLQAAAGGALTLTIDGVNVTTLATPALLLWFINNASMLEAAGKDAFKTFLFMLSQKKKQEAFDAMLNTMSAAQIAAQISGDAFEMQQTMNLHDQMVSALEDLALKLVESVGPKLLLALL